MNYTDAYKLLTGAVVPRPIAWVSTVSEDGVFNAAPFSFYNVVSADPPIICLSVGRRDGEKKDTTRNIEFSHDFVVNVVTEDVAQAMNLTSGEYPPEVDEFQVAKLTPVPSEKVKAPRIAESPINMECKLLQVLEFGTGSARYSLTLGEVVHFHARDDLIYNGKVDFAKLKALGRLAGDLYSTTGQILEMKRPRV